MKTGKLMLEKTCQYSANTSTLFNNDLFSRIWEGIGIGISVLDVIDEGDDFQYVSLNPVMEEIIPVCIDKLLNNTLGKLTQQEPVNLHLEKYQDCLCSRSSISFEELLLLNRQETWWLFNITPLINEESKIYQLLITATNITYLKYKEKVLSKSEEWFRCFIENANEIIYEHTLEGTLTYLSPKFTDLFGYETSDFIGKCFKSLIHPEDLPLCEKIFCQTIDTRGNKQTIIFRHKHKSEKWRWVQINAVPIYDKENQLIYCQGILRDITEEKVAQEELKYSNQLLKSIIESTSDAIFAKDIQGRYVLTNSTSFNLIRKLDKQMVCKGDENIFSLNIASELVNIDVQVIESGLPITLEELVVNRDGKVKTFLTTKSPWRDHCGNIIGLVGISRDITEQKQTEVQIKKQEQFLSSVFNGTQNAIFVIDVFKNNQFYFAGWNNSCEHNMGIPSFHAIGKTPEELFGIIEGQKIRAQYIKCLNADESITYEEFIVIKGKTISGLTTLNPLKDKEGKIYRIIGTTFDISARVSAEEALRQSEAELRQKASDLENTLKELQRTQSQLIQTEKMSSLGQLVAGIAHEINNPTSFIYGNIKPAQEYYHDLMNLISLYKEYYPQPIQQINKYIKAIDLEFIIEDLPKILTSMEVGAERIQNIVISLRNFAHIDEAECKTIDIHQGIESTLVILEHRFKANNLRPAINLVKSYSSLPLVDCYPGELNQVFMSILVNALDALDEYGNPNQSFNPKISIYTELIDNQQVMISISDNGIGVGEEIRKHLFDPFFTTKPVGKGTGMGLAVSYQIITEKHGGSLDCISLPEKGAKFVIKIPLRQENMPS
jgi:two-component system, NtrC family, sensor kinase